MPVTKRGKDERVWGSMVKQAIKRGVVELERDEKSGDYVIRIARRA